MCECHQIGGPFIAEDPDCPMHGIAAQHRERDIEEILSRVAVETDVQALRALAQEIADRTTY